MTCIVAVEDEAKGRCWIGADSFSGTEGWADLLAGSKLQPFAKGAFIGFAGAIMMPMWQSMQHVTPPKRRESVEDWLKATCWKLRKRAKRDELDIDPKSDDSSVAVVACRGEAWLICPDFSIHRSRHGYASYGSGMPYALGSLASTGHLPGEERVRLALESAVRHCPTVRGPFDVRST